MTEIKIIKSSKHQEIAEELIENEQELFQLRQFDIQIQMLISDEVKQDKNKKLVRAELERVPYKFSWATNAVFTITLFQAGIAYFDEQQIRILILRELLKIQVAEAGNGELKYSLRSYDVQDFRSVISRFGVNWEENDLFKGVENAKKD